MSLKPAICTQCGGQIEVDDSKEAGICQFCGTAFITEKVIHQYVTQNNFAGATINIQGGIEDENLYMLARRAVEQKNVADILKYYGQLVERNPNDWEAVFYSSFFKGDDSIIMSNVELAVNLLLDPVEITNDNYDEYWNKLWNNILSTFLKKYDKEEHYSDPKEIPTTRKLLGILENKINKEIEKNVISWKLCLLFSAIYQIEKESKIFTLYWRTRDSLTKILKLKLQEDLSEKDKESIESYLLNIFNWFMEAPCFYTKSAYDNLIESCPYVNQKEQKLICYKNLIKNFSNLEQFKEEIKTIREAILKLESELPPEQREFTNESTKKLKQEKKDKRMGCFCFLLVILLIGGFFFYGILNETEMSIKEFFQELFKLIKGE